MREESRRASDPWAQKVPTSGLSLHRSYQSEQHMLTQTRSQKNDSFGYPRQTQVPWNYVRAFSKPLSSWFGGEAKRNRLSNNLGVCFSRPVFILSLDCTQLKASIEGGTHILAPHRFRCCSSKVMGNTVHTYPCTSAQRSETNSKMILAWIRWPIQKEIAMRLPALRFKVKPVCMNLVRVLKGSVPPNDSVMCDR